MREEEMVMSGYNLITWYDQRLKWNESQHPGIKFRIKIAISYNLYALLLTEILNFYSKHFSASKCASG